MWHNDPMVMALEQSQKAAATGKILEGAGASSGAGQGNSEPFEYSENAILESAMEINDRADIMRLVLIWLADDDASMHNWDSVYAFCADRADIDESGEVDSEEEEDLLNAYIQIWTQALVALGADSEKVVKAIDDEDDALWGDIAVRLNAKLADNDKSDDEIIDAFAAEASGKILEAKVAETDEGKILESKKRVVRAGKIVYKNKRIGKYKMSPEQRAAVKKMQAGRKKKAGQAERKRKKSVKIGQKAGLY